MVGEGEVVVLLGSDLIGLSSLQVFRIRFGEVVERFLHRRETLVVGELGIREEG
jgi:hypothetical protein